MYRPATPLATAIDQVAAWLESPTLVAHGVRELWTHDRDFGRFPALAVRNPLV
jgi:hypothetical protein